MINERANNFFPYIHNETVICCPHCGGDYLHPRKFEICNNGEEVKTHFWCEHCPETSVFRQYFHEGRTFAEWEELYKFAEPDS